MCLKNVSDLKIAEEDFTVYKVLETIYTPKLPLTQWEKYNGKNFNGIILNTKCKGNIYADRGNVWFCHNYRKLSRARTCLLSLP